MTSKDMEEGIVRLIRKAETYLPNDVVAALQQAYNREEGVAKIQIETMLKNIKLAKKTGRPLCQDTGTQTFFVQVGTRFPHIGKLQELITRAVRRAIVEIPLRPNTVDVFTGKNHLRNIGNHLSSISWEFIPGDRVTITALPKGGGSENMSKLGMLNPSCGISGVKDFVVQEMIQAGGNPCPPTIVGVGIGGNADLCLKLGKQALLRPVGSRHKSTTIARMEEELVRQINKSGIGPMGLGGKTTVLDVHIETAPRHPGSFPVGIVMQCWADRRATMIIYPDGRWKVK